MSDKDKVYYYEKLLKMTIENYNSMVNDSERILDYAIDKYSLKIRIDAYNDIIKILTTILKLEDK